MDTHFKGTFYEKFLENLRNEDGDHELRMPVGCSSSGHITDGVPESHGSLDGSVATQGQVLAFVPKLIHQGSDHYCQTYGIESTLICGGYIEHATSLHEMAKGISCVLKSF